MTTRSSSKDRLRASNNALRFLRSVNRLVGPENANLAKAFQFNCSDRSLRRSGGWRRNDDDEESPDEDGLVDEISTEIATTGSLFSRAEDFWHAVGWAFNCSLVYPKRWERWKLWLGLMLDVLEEDWRAREDAAHAEVARGDEGEAVDAPMANSIISKYLQLGSSRYGGARRVVRAIFADAGQSSLREFKEVFHNETIERREGNNGMKKMQDIQINIDEDIYGDYLCSDESDGDGDGSIVAGDPSRTQEHNSPILKPKKTSEKKAGARNEIDSVDGFDLLGGVEAFTLRQRLLALLSDVSANLPTHFTPLDSLYNTYSEHIRPLPLPTFALVLSPTLLPSTFTPSARSSLIQLILLSLISTSAPLPPESANDELDQDILQTCFLPYPANTNNATDNAKVSLLVEALLRLLAHHIGLDGTPELKEAVERGIAAREAKTAKPDRRSRGGSKGDAEKARFWMGMSAIRLRAVVEDAG
ncbi:MAG: hypothetical protein M1837_000041 [Sclerophora amabilis]|nr:MAG: hypothetical protein M1837_000041 [Sclerophora amabilis]